MAGRTPDPLPEVTLAELTGLLNRAARMTGAKDLYCAQDVSDVIRAALPAAGPALRPWEAFYNAGVIGRLLAVNIIVSPDAPPGVFRLVRHADQGRMSCEVVGETVTHRRCPVLAEGILAGE